MTHPEPQKACAPAVTIGKPCMSLLPTEIDSLAFSAHYFHGQVSQSRIDGSLWSSACTVIATLTAHRVLTGILPLPNNWGGYPPIETLEVLVACMRQGSHVYDSKKLTGLLTVDHASSGSFECNRYKSATRVFPHSGEGVETGCTWASASCQKFSN